MELFSIRIQRTFQLVSTGKGGNQRAENEGGGGERHHSHSGRGELTFGGSKVKRLEAENENLKRNIVNLQKQVQAEQREQTKMENRHSSEINRVDRSYRQKIAEYDNRLELIDTYFPIVKELMPIAEQCREVGFTEELTRRIVSLQPVEFKGRLYSKEYKEKFRTEHSTATVERNPQEKGKFRLCIDGIPILDWFRKKFQEIKEKLGLNTPVENKQRKGLKI